MFISQLLTMPSLKKSLIVEQFQRNYLKPPFMHSVYGVRYFELAWINYSPSCLWTRLLAGKQYFSFSSFPAWGFFFSFAFVLLSLCLYIFSTQPPSFPQWPHRYNMLNSWRKGLRTRLIPQTVVPSVLHLFHPNGFWKSMKKSLDALLSCNFKILYGGFYEVSAVPRIQARTVSSK